MPTRIVLHDVDALIAAIEKAGFVKGCQDVGVSKAAVERRRKEDEAFGSRISAAMARAETHNRERYLQARARRTERERSQLTDEDWDNFLNVLATTSAKVVREMRGAPVGRKRVEAKRRADPAFDARYRAVLESRSFESTKHVGRAGERSRRSPGEMIAVWSKYLELLATRTIGQIAALPGMPGHVAFQKKRRRDAEFDEAAAAVLASRSFRRSVVLTPDQIEGLVNAMREVGVVRASMRAGSPSLYWIYTRGFSDPQFGARLAAARDHHRSEIRKKVEERRAAAARAAQRDKVPIGEAFNRQLRQNDLYRLAATAASSAARYLQGDARDDLIADLVLGVLNGEYGTDDLKAQARKYQTAYYGALRDTSSMDVSRSADDARTLHDQIGSWDYG